MTEQEEGARNFPTPWKPRGLLVVEAANGNVVLPVGSGDALLNEWARAMIIHRVNLHDRLTGELARAREVIDEFVAKEDMGREPRYGHYYKDELIHRIDALQAIADKQSSRLAEAVELFEYAAPTLRCECMDEQTGKPFPATAMCISCMMKDLSGVIQSEAAEATINKETEDE